MENKRHILVREAVKYAAECHFGTNRKGTEIPYIVHPMEAAAIAAGITDKTEVIAAAVLHDVVEDTPATIDDIKTRFGERVAELVDSESENKRPDRPESETWKVRKQETINHLKSCDDEDVIIIAMADKLSNLRAMNREYMILGDKLWDKFNQKNPAEHKWYYSSFVETCKRLENTQAYMEYKVLLEKTFGKY